MDYTDHPVRGIRLNNPGNIEKGAKWRGLAPDRDSRFCTFVQPEYGIRAICRILRTYQKKHGINTIKGVISRWAPHHENPTDAYAANVAKWSGIPADKEVDLTAPSVLIPVIAGIIRQENGVQPYPEHVIRKGVEMGTK